MRDLFRLIIAPALLGVGVLGLGGCAQRGCANYSVLDYLDASDRKDDLAHLGLVRESATTRFGPTGTEAQCSIWERRRIAGTDKVALRPQYYAIRLHDNGWVMEK